MKIVFSKKLAQIDFLRVMLGDSITSARNPQAGTSNAVVGWGHKSTASKARSYAKEHHLPYVAVEDGFLRSLDLGCNGAAPLSLVVDESGIYYDATSPSDLEDMLQNGGPTSEEMLESARLAIEEIKKHHLSKYNHAPDARPRMLGDPDPDHPRVLLIDQTLGDSSVGLGLAGVKSFSNMLNAAKKYFPGGRFFVKTHPDVLAGKKKGYLTEAAMIGDATLIAEDVSPISLLEQADAVFCVTSQMGFEALLLGKKVWCFGIPFYSGWGLTQDALACRRRTSVRTIEEVFAAAYIRYARYVDPIRGIRSDVHQTIRRLALQRRFNEANRGYHACFGYSLWKHPHAKAFCQSTGASFGFFKYFFAGGRAVAAAARHGGDIVAWSSKCLDGYLEQRCRKAGVPLIRMEDGFIRSVGLGSNFHWPYSLVLDRSGIYYDPTGPSDLEALLNGIQSDPDHDSLCARAAKLQKFIIEKGITKYNVGNSVPSLDLPTGRRIILVPGQVEDDASVRRGGFVIQSNLALLREVRRHNSDAYIIYKPHPDVEVKNRKGRIDDEVARQYADVVIRNVRMDVMLGAVDEVHTLTSLTGFEALLRGIKVTTYGGPFYAGWGLTNDMAARSCAFFSRRKARLSLDELVACTLLLYPRYYDWQTKSFCFAEDVCYRLTQPDGQMHGKYFVRMFAWAREIWRKIGL